MIRKKFFRWIFKSELEKLEELYRSYSIEENKLKSAVKRTEKKYNLINNFFSLFSTGLIIDIATNKRQEELIVALTYDYCIDNKYILLYGGRYQGVSGLPRILFKVNKQVITGLEKKYIYIEDILMENNNIGNGTIAMNALIKYARIINAQWISGSLSPVDNDHAERRDHFYEKFGFIIKDSKIRLNL